MISSPISHLRLSARSDLRYLFVLATTLIARYYPKCDTVPACVKLLGSPKADFEARTKEPFELLLYLLLSFVAFLGGTISACSAMASAPPETFAPPLSARARERLNSKDLM